VAGLVAELARDGQVQPGSLVEVPQLPRHEIEPQLASAGLPVAGHQDWTIFWTTSPEPAEDLDAHVTPLTEADYPAIEAHLSISFPQTNNRPGTAGIRAWHGIHAPDGTLAGVAADRSTGGIGYLVAIAVSPTHQGHGYGAALTRSLTRTLVAEFGTCGLGVTMVNTRARDLYQRLGYRHGINLTTLRLT
jgi:ribosomal protein S18 acetylase RimI-like enzyme